MATSKVDGNLQILGTVTATSLSLTSGTIAAARLVHRNTPSYSQATAAVVATATQPLYTAYASGTVTSVIVTVDTAPTGGDKAFTVDVKKSTGGGAYATILSSTQSISSASTAKTAYYPTISSSTYSAGDIFEVVVTTSGSTGTQGYGVQVTLVLDENPS